MRYRVHGISRMTGMEATVIVEAKHHDAAEAIAQRQMIVAEVTPEGGLEEPEIFDRNAADRMDQSLVDVVPQSDTGGRSPNRRKRPGRSGWVIAFVLAIGFLAALLLWLRRH